MATATAFEDRPKAARAALRMLERPPVEPQSHMTGTPLDLEELSDASVLCSQAVCYREPKRSIQSEPGEMMQAVQHLRP